MTYTENDTGAKHTHDTPTHTNTDTDKHTHPDTHEHRHTHTHTHTTTYIHSDKPVLYRLTEVVCHLLQSSVLESRSLK